MAVGPVHDSDQLGVSPGAWAWTPAWLHRRVPSLDDPWIAGGFAMWPGATHRDARPGQQRACKWRPRM